MSCAPSVNRCDYSRLSGALAKADPCELVFVTLTFPRRGTRAAAWRGTRRAWKRLRDRLAYRYGSRVGGKLLYAQTWEQHRDGWPHVHAILWAPKIAAALIERGSFHSRGPGRRERRTFWRWSLEVFRPLARASGFGRVQAEPPRRGRTALASYLVKKCAQLTGTWSGSIGGELSSSASKDQTPRCAPRGFRRLRCSLGWLPPRHRRDYLTGGLLQAPLDRVEAALLAGRLSLPHLSARLEGWRTPTPVQSARSP